MNLNLHRIWWLKHEAVWAIQFGNGTIARARSWETRSPTSAHSVARGDPVFYPGPDVGNVTPEAWVEVFGELRYSV